MIRTHSAVGRNASARLLPTGAASAILLSLALQAAVPANAAPASGPKPYEPKTAPVAPLPRPNGLDDFLAAAKLVRADPSQDCDIKVDGGAPRKWSTLTPSECTRYWPQRLAFIRDAVAQDQDAVARMHEGLSKRCAMPNSRSEDMPFPSLAQFRVLARLNRGRMDVYRADGDHGLAVQVGTETFQVASGFTRGGGAINFLVAVAIRSIVRAPLVASADELSDVEATEAGRRMEVLLASSPKPVDVMFEERNGSLVQMMRMFDQIAKAAKSAPASQRKAIRKQLSQRDTILRQLDAYERSFIAELAKPTVARRQVPLPTATLARETTEVQSKMATIMDKDDAQNRLLRCQLAITAYRRARGHLPPSLQALSLQAYWRTDPYTGRPFVYRPTANGYLLYSVGPNFRDDGGHPAGAGGDDVGLWEYRPGQVPLLPDGERMVPHMTAQENSKK